MTEYTEDQIQDMLMKARQEQANFEHYRIAKDSGFRIALTAITTSVNSGLVDPEVLRVWQAEYQQFRTDCFPQTPKKPAADDDAE